ncbi:MAG TPA: hypothetical protein VJB14_13655 [Planctomycetota bacterium]|nr:hypothetical protein [Planctomycetota bacterium]
MVCLMLLLAQTAAAERSLEEAVDAFAKGEHAARTELLNIGTGAILSLRKARGRAPERFDALLLEIKKQAAGGDGIAKILEALEARDTIEPEESDFWVACEYVAIGFPLIVDPLLLGSGFKKNVRLAMKDRPRREILESLCRQAELDWGFFYGVVLVAAPERLWPAGPPPRSAALKEEETKRAAAWIDRLGSDRVDEREEALAALRKIGPALIPLLEKRAADSEAETGARCRDLIGSLRRPPPSGVFHRPAAERQTLTAGEEKILKQLRQNPVSFKVGDLVLTGTFRLLLGPQGIRCSPAPALGAKRATVDIQNQSLWAVVCVCSHAYGFDFLILDGAVVIDTREEIERRLSSGR